MAARTSDPIKAYQTSLSVPSGTRGAAQKLATVEPVGVPAAVLKQAPEKISPYAGLNAPKRGFDGSAAAAPLPPVAAATKQLLPKRPTGHARRAASTTAPTR